MKWRNVLIIFLLIAFIIMTIGYAELVDEVNIFEVGKIDAKWRIEFTDVEMTKSYQATEINKITSATTVVVEVDLKAPGGYVEYTIAIENSGTLDAVVEQIWIKRTNEIGDISFAFEGIKEGDYLDAKEVKEVVFRIKWDEDVSNNQLLDGQEKIYAQILFVQKM